MVIQRKLDVIQENLQLKKCVGYLEWVNDSVIVSKAYSAISCDLTNLSALKCNLKKAEIDFNVPTLFISECVLTYINPER